MKVGWNNKDHIILSNGTIIKKREPRESLEKILKQKKLKVNERKFIKHIISYRKTSSVFRTKVKNKTKQMEYEVIELSSQCNKLREQIKLLKKEETRLENELVILKNIILKQEEQNEFAILNFILN